MKVALFVDGVNMFYAQKKLGWHLDYKRILHYFVPHPNDLYNAFYYTGVQNPTETKEENFLNALTMMGYTVRRKRVKVIFDLDSGEEIRKANLDTEMVVDMFNTADNYQRGIIFSGDSDFERALELLRTRGKEVIVVSTRGMVAIELINSADRYYDLQYLREEFEKLPGT
ncbi:NYN domain-containing protein [bacterium]|nr:NYN domain-containing protein [bacterium]